jgi:hypothetical protein
VTDEFAVADRSFLLTALVRQEDWEEEGSVDIN